MSKVLVVFLGGGVGSALRYWVGLQSAQLLGTAWPFGTFLVNVLGCTVMGILFRVVPAAWSDGAVDLRLLLLTGVLGGFTTFSAFALDTAQLWMREEGAAAFVYVAASVLLSLIGVALGLWIGKVISA
jgi:fluoride exporter